MLKNYLKYKEGWQRYTPNKLNRLCEMQRIEPLFHHTGFHYRKQSVVPSFRYYQGQGIGFVKAYQLACETQMTGLSQIKCLNIDSRTTWEFTSPPQI